MPRFIWQCAIALLATEPTLALSQETYEVKEIYLRALADFEAKKISVYPEVGLGFFKGMNWVEKTAALNVFCQNPLLTACKSAVKIGINDAALVVRDHALRLVLASEAFSGSEKQEILEATLKDGRNYRKKAPLWIVNRAKLALENAKTEQSR